MGIFPKNPNEAAYVGGKKHFRDVLKNSSPTDALIYRIPEEDFNEGSTLVVMPGEKAIFVNQGVIEQEFAEGSYQLSTANFPFISRLRNSLTGGISSFNCVVYFVRTAISREILWGTETPLKVYDNVIVDPTTGVGVETEVKARGSYRVKIDNPSVFLRELHGNSEYSEGQEGLNKFFRNQILSYVMPVLADELNNLNAPLNTAPSRQLKIAESVSTQLTKTLEVYGIRLLNFNISGLTIVDNEERRQLQAEAGRRRDLALSGQAERMRYEALGTNYQQSEMLGMLRDAASNEGGGAMLNAGMGLAMGAGIGQTAAGVLAQNMPFINQPNPLNAGGNPASVGAQNVGKASVKDRLLELKELMDAGLITAEEFQQRKDQILGEV